MRIRVGRVGRPHGLAGAFVVDEASEDPERFAVGAKLHALHSVSHLRDDPSYICGAGTEVTPQAVGVARQDVATQRFDEAQGAERADADGLVL